MEDEATAITPHQPMGSAIDPHGQTNFAAGVTALAHMTDLEFDTRLAALKHGQERLARIHREIMREGVDYGVIPGTNKPTLLKPGAEKLALVYGLVPEFVDEIRYGMVGGPEPPISIETECRLHVGALFGPVVGTGKGACNSYETKYRYRNAQRVCPSCGVSGSIRRSKPEYGGGFYCDQRQGCGAKFKDDDPQITSQQPGRIDNPDPWELQNTILKMAHKRALVAAVLITTGTSGGYTQDAEDYVTVTPDPGPAPTPPAQQGSPPRQTTQSGTRRATGARDTGPAPEGPEPPPQRSTAPQAGSQVGPLKCTAHGCGRQITQGTRTLSMNKYGHALCGYCQKDADRQGVEATLAGVEPADEKATPATGPADPNVRPPTDGEKENAQKWVDYGVAQGVLSADEVELITKKLAHASLTFAECLAIRATIESAVAEKKNTASAAGREGNEAASAPEVVDQPALPEHDPFVDE